MQCAGLCLRVIRTNLISKIFTNIQKQHSEPSQVGPPAGDRAVHDLQRVW